MHEISASYSVLVTFLLSPLGLLTFVIVDNNGSYSPSLSLSGMHATGFFPAVQEIHGDVCSTMSHHDGAGFKTYGSINGTGPVLFNFQSED